MKARISEIKGLLKEDTRDSIGEIVTYLQNEKISNKNQIIKHLRSEVNRKESNFLHWLARRGDCDLLKEFLDSGVSFSPREEERNRWLPVFVKMRIRG